LNFWIIWKKELVNFPVNIESKTIFFTFDTSQVNQKLPVLFACDFAGFFPRWLQWAEQPVQPGLAS